MAWYHRLRNLVRPRGLQSDLDRELRFHVAERADELREGGMEPQEALLEARRQFGNYTSQVERTREMDINGRLESAGRNLRLAVRSLAKSPAFSITVILTLALGIGVNSAVFSAIDTVLLRPLPFPEADQLVNVAQSAPNVPQPHLAPVRLEDWNRLNDTFQAISGYYTEDESELSGELPEKLRCAIVAPRFLQVWGVAPEVGRGFNSAEEHFGGPLAILISDRLWRRRFAADPKVTDRKLRLGRSFIPIIGVLPPSLDFRERGVDLWMVGPPDAPYAQDRASTWFLGIGRLKPGVTVAAAQSNLAAVQAGLGHRFPKTDAKISATLTPMKETAVGGVRRSLWILFGAVTVLLLIACTNVAALLLSRATQKQHEVAVRFSLGASRAAVMTQFFTEVAMLAVSGALLGLLLASASSYVFRTLARDLPRVEEITLDWRIVLYSLGWAVTAALLCGILPALRGTRRNLSGRLVQGGRSQVAGRNPVQFVLVGVQVALAVSLLCGAGLLLRSFQALGRVAPGFDATGVLTFHINSSWGETTDPKASSRRTGRILQGLRTLPGVEAAGVTYNLPGVPGKYPTEFVPAEGRAESDPKMVAENRAISPGYLATLRIPLLAGEECRDGESAPTLLVNRSFANAYFGGLPAIGHHLTAANGFLPPSEIRGIVGDVRETGLDLAPVPTAYFCYSGLQPGMYFVVRTHGDPMAMAQPVRRKLHELEPQRSVYDLSPLTGQISDAYAENRLRTILLTFFAITAISLACIGLYGTLSYLVSVRQREVGLRLALGALRIQIVRQFLMQGLRIAVLGSLAGLAMAVALSRFLSGMLYGVSTTDGTTLAGVIGGVLLVSIVASLLPAIRAARLEPMQVLRDE